MNEEYMKYRVTGKFKGNNLNNDSIKNRSRISLLYII
jgi:hypothetical protein